MQKPADDLLTMEGMDKALAYELAGKGDYDDGRSCRTIS